MTADLTWSDIERALVADQKRLLVMCTNCHLTRYEHIDHTHVDHCPFGDCGKFKAQS